MKIQATSHSQMFQLESQRTRAQLPRSRRRMTRRTFEEILLLCFRRSLLRWSSEYGNMFLSEENTKWQSKWRNAFHELWCLQSRDTATSHKLMTSIKSNQSPTNNANSFRTRTNGFDYVLNNHRLANDPLGAYIAMILVPNKQNAHPPQSLQGGY